MADDVDDIDWTELGTDAATVCAALLERADEVLGQLDAGGDGRGAAALAAPPALSRDAKTPATGRRSPAAGSGVAVAGERLQARCAPAIYVS